MNEKTAKWLDENKDYLISVLQNTIRYKSVRDDASAEKGAPFGSELGKCLEYVLAEARNLGFETKNYDGYIGAVDCGNGNEQLGILSHLDVVPEGNGWKYPPFAAEIHNDRIWGRGALDDKGPAIAALFALASVKASGFHFKRRVRIILGCDEECDMGCLKHYVKVEKMPDLSFSPDAEYPLINSEKMIYGAEYGRSFNSRIKMKGGTVSNAVADSCDIYVPLDIACVENAVGEVKKQCGMNFSVTKQMNGCTIHVTGLAAHASTPHLGKNAFYAALDLVRRLPLEEDSIIASILYGLLKYNYHGEDFGIDSEDASGRLTMNCGVIDWDESGIKRLTVDIRAPMSSDVAFIKRSLDNGFSKAGCVELNHHYSDGYYIPPENEIVSKLIAVYNDYFKEEAQPVAIGGGTYARYLKNAVAFGPERPGEPACIHMSDENVLIANLLQDAKIYADAIIALAC